VVLRGGGGWVVFWAVCFFGVFFLRKWRGRGFFFKDQRFLLGGGGGVGVLCVFVGVWFPFLLGLAFGGLLQDVRALFLTFSQATIRFPIFCRGIPLSLVESPFFPFVFFFSPLQLQCKQRCRHLDLSPRDFFFGPSSHDYFLSTLHGFWLLLLLFPTDLCLRMLMFPCIWPRVVFQS